MINHWKAISDYQKQLGYNIHYMPDIERINYARECSLALFMEVAELVESFQWKPWRHYTEPDIENMKREMIDILYFLHHIAECFGITENDLEQKFIEVDQNNLARIHNGYNCNPIPSMLEDHKKGPSNDFELLKQQLINDIVNALQGVKK